MTASTRPLALAILGRGLIDPDEPVVHADDVGLLRGLAVFETVRVYGGRAFALEAHLERLRMSAARLGLEAPGIAELVALADQVVGAAARPDCSLRFTLTGGRDGAARPLTVAGALALPDDLEEVRARGIRLVSLQLGVDPRLRRESPWLLDGVKSTSYAVNMAAWAEARRRGADDAVFLAADGSVLEGPVTNVWWRHGAFLMTPALDLGILAGVTRAHLIELARSGGYQVREGSYPVTDMAAAEEAFTSSSVREVMPVVGLDGSPIGTGRPGPAAAALQAMLRAAAAAAPAG